jgi:NTE family protein
MNERIDAVDPAHGYRMETRLTNRPDNDPRTILVLAFSGGGTRAAAFAYGVLETLRSKVVVVQDQSSPAARCLAPVPAVPAGLTGLKVGEQLPLCSSPYCALRAE